LPVLIPRSSLTTDTRREGGREGGKEEGGRDAPCTHCAAILPVLIPRSSLTTNTILDLSWAPLKKEDEAGREDEGWREGGAPPEMRQRRRASWKAGPERG